jgi:hypothetical protein
MVLEDISLVIGLGRIRGQKRPKEEREKLARSSLRNLV